jgi:hypothetical protein
MGDESAVAEAQATLAAQTAALVEAAAEQLPDATPTQVEAIHAELWTLDEKRALVNRLESAERELESWRAHQTAQAELAAAQASVSPMPSVSSSDPLPISSTPASVTATVEAMPPPVEIALAAPVADSSPAPVKKRRLGRALRRR